MGPMFFRIIEIAFTAYMVPALLVPLVWVWSRILNSRRRGVAAPVVEAEGQSRRLFQLFVVWLVLFLAVAAGVPLSRWGAAAITLCWAIYAATNLMLAWFLFRFTVTYGSIPDGSAADRVFLRFMAIIVTQPLVTAAAFAVLNNAMGVAWNAQVPELPAIQEGI